MRIGINCRSFINRQYTGIGRYTYHLLSSLSQIDRVNDYHLYVKKGFFNISKKVPRFGVDNFHVEIDRFKKGIAQVLGEVDIYHSPSHEFISVNSGSKAVVTIHDLIFKAFPQGHTQKTIDDTEKQFESIIAKASKLICCSQNTKKDLQKYFGVGDDKISLVYQGVDKGLFYRLDGAENHLAKKMLKRKGIHEPYILTVGTIEPRKNLGNILQAFDKLRTRKQFFGKLVVIGMKGWMSEGVAGLIRKLELQHDVIFCGYLSNQELRWFYNHAQAFLFPSFYEGFGFPIVEAFCCGTPVVTSNVSSCPEVAGDAACIVNPYDPEEISVAVASLVNDKKKREQMSARGLKRALDFSFMKTAENTLKVYQEAYRS